MNAEDLRGRLRVLFDERGVNPVDVSRRLGRSQGYLSDFLRAKKDSLGAAEIAQIEAEFELSPGSLHLGGGRRVVQTYAPTASKADDKREGFRPPPDFLGERDLPVFSAVEGGPGEMVVSTDPIEFVPRPWFLRNVKEGYAVIVTGESMVPVYEPGDMVIVNPRLQAIKGKNAIFVADEEHGGFTATVKRLEKSTATDWHVRQWNPPDGTKPEFLLPKKRWPKALRVVGKYEGG